MEFISILGLVLGTSWASGVNLYAAVATMGLMHRFYGIELPGGLDVCGHPAVITVAVALYCLEFFADKIPYVDSCWDVAHTFIRIPAGAVLAMAAFADFDPTVRAIAFLLGGSVALSSHGTKAAARVLVNASPEPASNVLVSTVEDAAALGVITMAILHPILAGLISTALIATTIYFLQKAIRRVTRGLIALKSSLFCRRATPVSTRH